MSRSTSTTTGRADSKIETLIYYEGISGIIFKGTYTQQANEHDLLAEPIDLDMAESCGVGALVRNQELASATQTTVAVLNSEPEPVIGGSIYHNSLARRIESYVDDATNWVMTLNSSMAIVIDTDIYYTSKSNYNLTQGTALTVDRSGDPEGDPDDWKSFMAGGNSVDMNYLLVGQDGADYTSGTDYQIMSEKITDMHRMLYKTGGTGAWADAGTALEPVGNTATTSSDMDTYYPRIQPYTSQNEPIRFDDLTDYEVIIEDDYVFASNTYDINDIAMVINSVTSKISVGTDDTEKLSITKVIAGVITHTAETLTEDALVSFALFNNTTTKEYAIGCYFAIDGVIDKADGAYIMQTGVFK